MRDASDAQLDAPFIRVDDEKKTAAYGPEQKPDSLGILFDAIIGGKMQMNRAAKPETVKYTRETTPLELTHGAVYPVLSVERGWYRVIDDTGEDYLYPAGNFEVVRNGETPCAAPQKCPQGGPPEKT